MLNKFLHNIIELGFSGVILWFIVILLLCCGVDYLLVLYEKIKDIPHKAYWYDMLNTYIFIVIFVLGIYKYE